MSLLAGDGAFGADRLPDVLPPPKWRHAQPLRPSTHDLLNILRYELWGKGVNLSHFVSHKDHDTKCEKIPAPFESAVFYNVAAG